MPPPPTEAGITGWLWHNIFASMADYSSIGASIRSILMAILSVAILYFGGAQIYALIDFTLLSAVFSDPNEIKERPAGQSIRGRAAFWLAWGLLAVCGCQAEIPVVRGVS